MFDLLGKLVELPIRAAIVLFYLLPAIICITMFRHANHCIACGGQIGMTPTEQFCMALCPAVNVFMAPILTGMVVTQHLHLVELFTMMCKFILV